MTGSIRVFVTGPDKGWPLDDRQVDEARYLDVVRKTFDTIDEAVAFVLSDNIAALVESARDVVERCNGCGDFREESRRIIDDRAYGPKSVSGRGAVNLEISHSGSMVVAAAA